MFGSSQSTRATPVPRSAGVSPLTVTSGIISRYTRPPNTMRTRALTPIGYGHESLKYGKQSGPRLRRWHAPSRFWPRKVSFLTPKRTTCSSDHLFAAFKLLEKRAWGDYTPDETPKKFPQYGVSRTSTPVGLGCWALFEAWVTAAKPKPATVDRWRVIFKALDAAFPDGANAISADQARTWAKGLTTKKRSARTVATNWVNAPRRVFAWGLEERLVAVNPFVGIKISVPRKAQTRESKAFTTAEASLILKAASGVSNIKTDAHAAQRWAPWLMAYTGARAGEITQLRGSDVQQRGSFHYAVLTPDAGTIKTRKVRVVPLHEHIIAQGFLSFVETRGKGPLFFTPEATKGAVDPFNPKRPRAVRIREALAAWVRKLGVSDQELSPNHAWRHTFKAQAERAGITEKISDAITGHAAATVGRSYGAPLAEDMAKALQKFPRYVV
jgi:integrase